MAFRTASSYAHHPNPKPRQLHYRGQVDAFGVYCPENGGVYLVPIDGLPASGAYLRVEPTANGQRRLIREAAPYEVAKITLDPRAGATNRLNCSSGPPGRP